MITTIKNMIIELFPDVWPIIIIITVISCSLRITYLIKKNLKFCFYKELFMLIFIIYVVCLFEVVTLQDNNYGLSNFIPFKEIFRYELGSRLFIKNIVGNILLFLPYGYFAAEYLKSKKFILPVLLTSIVSITIELVQLNIGRTFDIDDVILNTIGGLFGYLLFKVIEKIKNKLPKFFKTEGFVNFFVIIILIIIYIILMWSTYGKLVKLLMAGEKMFEIVNDSGLEIEELDVLEEYVKYVSKKLDIDKAIFNIIMTDEKQIHELNLNYRGIDRKTDVITFALEDGDDFRNPEFRVLGDIYISVPVAYEQASSYGHSRIREICFLATHGILHLLGYDHMEEKDEKIMFSLQEELLSDYEINR